MLQEAVYRISDVTGRELEVDRMYKRQRGSIWHNGWLHNDAVGTCTVFTRISGDLASQSVVVRANQPPSS